MSFAQEMECYLPTWHGKRYRIGMGCATIGARLDPQGHTDVQTLLLAAYESGIRYIDTSAQYGGSEYRVGRFLRTVDRTRMFVATKSPIPASLSPEEAAVHVWQGLRNSLDRLGVETLDLFQVHDVESLDQVLAPAGVFDLLKRARQEGLIRYFGLATRSHGLSSQIIDHGGFDTIITYSDYTPINSSAADLISRASREGLGVINGSPLAFGLLTGRDPDSLGRSDPDFERSASKARLLYRYCREHKIPITAVAMQFPLNNPEIDITLTGPGSVEELTTTMDSCRYTISPERWRDLRDKTGIDIPQTA